MHSSSTCTLPPISDLFALPRRASNPDYHHMNDMSPSFPSATMNNDSMNQHYQHHQHQHQYRNSMSAGTSSKVSTYYPPLKAKRKRASPSQLSVLNRVFSQTYFPSTELRIELGKHLGMSPRTVQIWFQNKRQSLRSRTRRFSLSSLEAAEDDDDPASYSHSYQYDMMTCPTSPPWTPASGSPTHDSEFHFALPPPSNGDGYATLSSPSSSSSLSSSAAVLSSSSIASLSSTSTSSLSSSSSPSSTPPPPALPSSTSSPSSVLLDQHQPRRPLKINLPPLRLPQQHHHQQYHHQQHGSSYYPPSPPSSAYPSPISIDSIIQ